MTRFTETENGISHPHLPLAIRLGDDGFVYVQAGESCGLTLDSKTGKITAYGTAFNIIADEFQIDGVPVDKSSLMQRAVGRIKDLFKQATPKFPTPKE